jgi:tetratricopeptide (TPR) repeat protein
MSEIPLAEGGPEVFEELRDRWQRLIEVGQLEEAEQILQRALAWARQHGDERRIDSVVCVLAAVAINLGCGDPELPNLREILLRSSDPGNCRLAAYYISQHYQFARNFKKSLFYARIACERAAQLERADLIAFSRNQLGNALLGESFVDRAVKEYETALGLITENSVWRARILNNLGYCRVLQKRFAEGYSCLYESLRLLRRFSAERFQMLPRLDLCFAHLETGKYQLAKRQGIAAIKMAEKLGDTDSIKNALYLLGETANLMGETEMASDYFTRLQRDYFPESPYLPGFLLAVDVRNLVNLHA